MSRKLAMLALALCHALPAQAMLADAYDKALLHAPDYLVRIAEQDATAEELNLARSQLLPQLNASASRGVARSKISSPGAGGALRTTDSDYDTDLWSLQLRQPILRAASLYGYRSSSRHVAAGAAQLEDARQELLVTLIATASQIVYADASLAAARSAAASASALLNLSMRQLGAGQATRRDVAMAQTDLARARQQIADAKLDHASQMASWRTLTGDTHVDLPPLPGDLAERLPMPVTHADALLSAASEQQPGLRAAREEAESRRLDVQRARSEHLPSLDLVATRSYSASNTENTIGSTYLTNRVDLQLTLPLFSGGATQSRVRLSQARQRQAEAQAQGLLAQTQAQIARSLAGLAQARQQAASSRAAREAAEINLRSAVLGMPAGTATLADKANADIALAVAERDLIKANAEALIHWAQLQRTLGRMDRSQLKALTTLLNWQEPANRAMSSFEDDIGH